MNRVDMTLPQHAALNLLLRNHPPRGHVVDNPTVQNTLGPGLRTSGHRHFRHR